MGSTAWSHASLVVLAMSCGREPVLNTPQITFYPVSGFLDYYSSTVWLELCKDGQFSGIQDDLGLPSSTPGYDRNFCLNENAA